MSGVHDFVDAQGGGLICRKCGVRICPPKGRVLNTRQLPKCTGGQLDGQWPHYLIDSELWAKARFPRRNRDEMVANHKVCEKCSQFDGDACKLIGSGLTGAVQLLRKLMIATEGCPLGKWEAKVVVRGMPWKPYRRPSVLQMVRHYALAIVRWIGRGRPVRSRVEVEIIWRICTKCSYFDNGKCRQCGCRLSDELKPLSNKIAMATEHCPKGKW